MFAEYNYLAVFFYGLVQCVPIGEVWLRIAWARVKNKGRTEVGLTIIFLEGGYKKN